MYVQLFTGVQCVCGSFCCGAVVCMCVCVNEKEKARSPAAINHRDSRSTARGALRPTIASPGGGSYTGPQMHPLPPLPRASQITACNRKMERGGIVGYRKREAVRWKRERETDGKRRKKHCQMILVLQKPSTCKNTSNITWL